MTSLIRDTTDLPQPSSNGTSSGPSASDIKKLYDEGTRAIRHQQLTYQENCCYIEGEQWVYRHSTRQEILNVPRRDPFKVRATIPRIGPKSRDLFAKILKRPLVFEVPASAPDDETIRGAKVAEAVLTDTARTQKWEQLREEIAWCAWKGGTGALCLDWDTAAGKYLGQTATGRGMGQGDVKLTALAITEFCTEPGTRDLERACWWIKAQAIPPNEAKKLYGLPKVPPASASPMLTPMQNRLSSTGGQPINLTLVLTYYERPNMDNKRGTVATVIGDKIVDGPHPWPFPFTDRLNVSCLKETTVEGRWTGRTIVTDAVPVQTALNHATTSVLEHLKSASNARVQGNTAEQHNAETWTDEPGEFIFYDVDPWQWMSAPPQPEWWMRMPAELTNSVDEIIGAFDFSGGISHLSGQAASVIVEQEDTPTARFAQKIADVWSDMATLVLQTYEQNVPPEERRQARIDIPGYSSSALGWNGDSFAGQTVARVPFEAVAPINEAARFAKLQFLVQSGLVTTARQASKFLEIPGYGGDFIVAIDAQVKKARDENYMLAQGEAEVPAAWDNHALHIEEHNDFRSSGQYRSLQPQIQQLVDLHVQAHSTLAAEEAAQQLLKAQYAPALAAAAQGTQPPGSAVPQQGPTGQPAVMGAQMGGNPDQGPPPPDPSQMGPGMMPQ